MITYDNQVVDNDVMVWGQDIEVVDQNIQVDNQNIVVVALDVEVVNQDIEVVVVLHAYSRFGNSLRWWLIHTEYSLVGDSHLDIVSAAADSRSSTDWLNTKI